jgi:hypothetical protein
MVDVAAARQDREDKGQHLATRERTAHTAREADRAVHERLEPEADGERRGQDQPRVGHEARVVECHLYPVETARY